MNTQTTIERDHNNPPDPLDEALVPFGDSITEAEGWLDGTKVENEGQMKAVDALLKDIRAAEKAVKQAEESESKPLYDQWKAAKARFSPTIEDLGRIKKGLASIVNDFKKKVAEEQRERERLARIEAEKKRREAEQAARQAQEGDIEAARAAAQAQQEAKDAQRQVTTESKERVKGLRKVTKYEITDYKGLLHWIAINRRDDLTAYLDEWARKNHRDIAADGLRVWQEEEAY